MYQPANFHFRIQAHLLLCKEVVQHPEQLEDTLLSTSITQGVVVDHKVRIHPAIVAPDVEPPGSSAMLLYYVHPWHEASYSNVVVRMLEGEDENVPVAKTMSTLCHTNISDEKRK